MGRIAILLAALTLSLPVLGGLSGLVHDEASGSLKAVAIDKDTGAVTPGTESIADCCRLGAGLTAVDMDGERFFAVGVLSQGDDAGQPALVTLSFDGDSVSSIQPDQLPQALLAWDSQFDRLISVRIETQPDPQIQWLSIDPATGVSTPIGPALTACCEILTGLAVLDSPSQTLYFVGRELEASAWQLMAVDLGNGSTTEIAPLPSNHPHPGFMAKNPESGMLEILMQASPGQASRLYQADPATGSISLIGTQNDDDCCLIGPGAMASRSTDHTFWLLGGSGTGMSPSSGFVALYAMADSGAAPRMPLTAGYQLHALVVSGTVFFDLLFTDRFQDQP